MSLAPTIPPSYRLSHRQALWVQGSILVSFLAAASAPSPLYAIYRDAWGFSALTLTIVFSVYALALLAALLVFGTWSDYRGRREVVIVSLVLEFVSMLLFWRADSVAWLIAARVLQGIATGIATSAISAGLLDLHREHGSLINGVAPMVGLGVGALGASALLQLAPAPTEFVFDLLLAVFALMTLAAYFLPETVERKPVVWRSLRPTIAIPVRARRLMRQLLLINTAQWALAGFCLSLGPTLARVVTVDDAPVVGGALISAMVFSSAAAIALWRNRAPRSALMVGAAALSIGIGIAMAGVLAPSTAAFFAGTVIAGAGFGAAFTGSVRSLVPLAAPHERAGLMSGFFVLSYLAFSLPPIAAGSMVEHFGLIGASVGLMGTLVGMTVLAWLSLAKSHAV